MALSRTNLFALLYASCAVCLPHGAGRYYAPASGPLVERQAASTSNQNASFANSPPPQQQVQDAGTGNGQGSQRGLIMPQDPSRASSLFNNTPTLENPTNITDPGPQLSRSGTVQEPANPQAEEAMAMAMLEAMAEPVAEEVIIVEPGSATRHNETSNPLPIGAQVSNSSVPGLGPGLVIGGSEGQTGQGGTTGTTASIPAVNKTVAPGTQQPLPNAKTTTTSGQTVDPSVDDTSAIAPNSQQDGNGGDAASTTQQQPQGRQPQSQSQQQKRHLLLEPSTGQMPNPVGTGTGQDGGPASLEVWCLTNATGGFFEPQTPVNMSMKAQFCLEEYNLTAVAPGQPNPANTTELMNGATPPKVVTFSKPVSDLNFNGPSKMPPTLR